MYVRVHANAPGEGGDVLWSAEREALLRMLGSDGDQRSEFVSRATSERSKAFDSIPILIPKSVLIRWSVEGGHKWKCYYWFSHYVVYNKKRLKILFINIDSLFVSHENLERGKSSIYKNRGKWKRLFCEAVLYRYWLTVLQEKPCKIYFIFIMSLLYCYINRANREREWINMFEWKTMDKWV